MRRRAPKSWFESTGFRLVISAIARPLATDFMSCELIGGQVIASILHASAGRQCCFCAGEINELRLATSCGHVSAWKTINGGQPKDETQTQHFPRRSYHPRAPHKSTICG